MTQRKPMWNEEAVKAYESGQGVVLVENPYPHYIPLDDTSVKQIAKGNEHMNFNQGKLVDGLIEDVMKTIHKYDDSLYMATVIGALEFVKLQLIEESRESDDDE